jgi:hypothetical protein
MRNFSPRRSWRLALVIATMVAAFVLPATASATVCPQDGPQYCGVQPAAHHPYAGWSGWGYVQGSTCPPGAYCFWAGGVQAWRWNGSWSSQLLTNGTQVYIYPYAVGWSWVWTQSTGWLAVADKYVWVRSYPIAYA